ncbi:MAG: hypothetical protein FJX76_15665 [Armatimonadetes bacterium]|nr:hypothetical protein [Armatimonadota bacterium]
MPDLDSGPAEWEKAIGVRAADNPHFVLMVDPFSFNVENMVAGLDFAFPRGAKIGGLASDARERGGNALFLDRRSWRSGLTGVALSGNLEVDAVVAQGCRPVGKPMLITAGRHNCIEELDGRRPLDVLHDLVASLDERDRALVRTSLSLGMVTDPFRLEYQEGDFLIRNLLGIDRERGFLAVGMLVRKGQTVQFHLRDAETSAQDLSRALERIPNPSSPQAALLFSCLGRGQHLYKVSNHDSDAFLRHVGPVPLGGFFCNGEIGPVGGTTFVHGYTSCFALFRPKG